MLRIDESYVYEYLTSSWRAYVYLYKYINAYIPFKFSLYASFSMSDLKSANYSPDTNSPHINEEQPWNYHEKECPPYEQLIRFSTCCLSTNTYPFLSHFCG